MNATLYAAAHSFGFSKLFSHIFFLSRSIVKPLLANYDKNTRPFFETSKKASSECPEHSFMGFLLFFFFQSVIIIILKFVSDMSPFRKTCERFCSNVHKQFGLNQRDQYGKSGFIFDIENIAVP